MNGSSSDSGPASAWSATNAATDHRAARTQELPSPPITDFQPSRWMGWRLRLLVAAALFGCLVLMAQVRWLAAVPSIAATWSAGEHGELVLAATTVPSLQPYIGQHLVSVSGSNGGEPVQLGQSTAPSPRWVTLDAERSERSATWRSLNAVLSQPEVALTFANQGVVKLSPEAGGVQNLPNLLWLLDALALMLYLVAMVVLLARPTPGNALFALMATCQAINLAIYGAESAPILGLPRAFIDLQTWLPMVLDLCTAAAMVHGAGLYPRRVAGVQWLAAFSWLYALTLSLTLLSGHLPHAWWWIQLSCGSAAVLTLCLLQISLRQRQHPLSLVLQRFTTLGLIGWSLLTLTTVASQGWPSLHVKLVPLAGTVWCVFFSCLLLLTPFVSRAQTLMREFSLLALVSTVATLLDLGFIAIFSLSKFTSLSLALFLALGVYVGARQWILDRVRRSKMHTTERMFEQLYRIARAVEAHPERSADLMLQLLRDLFDPMEASIEDRPIAAARVVDAGSALVLPAPILGSEGDGRARSIVLRYAQRGRRLFQADDAILSDRIVDQLRRAVAFDHAVEQGRSEERMRLAQDLHDDIGARLLTLMYQASTPEMEAYVRHTLLDLKTLTRGLAVANQRLSHAAAEWKADLTQRLIAAGITLEWKLETDNDLLLSVVQWSALTRVLRELVSNVMSHAQAQNVQIDIALRENRLQLCVSDDGIGRNPSGWSHGLGLGGVRKRVKQLGGTVQWQEAPARGIRCEVVVEGFGVQ